MYRERNMVLGLRILIVAALAVALRVYDLGVPSLWMDEVIAASHVENPVWRIPFSTFRHDMHPPLYFLQLGLWSALGNSDQVLLWNSVVWGLGVVAAVWFLAQKLYGPSAGFIAATLVAVSPGAVEYSQSLRMYSMMTFLIIITFVFYEIWIDRIKNTGLANFKPWGLSIVIIALCICYSHAVGFFFVFFLGLYGLYRVYKIENITIENKRSIFWKLFFSYGVVALLTLPIIARSAIAPSASYSMDSLPMILRQVTLVFFGRGSAGEAVFAALTVFLLLAILVFAFLPGERRRPIWIFGLLAPLAINIAISALVKPVFKPWIFSYAAPLSCVALAGVIVTLGEAVGRQSRRKLVAIGAAAGLVALSFLGGLSVYYQPLGKPQDYRGAAAYIREHAAPGDGVVGVGIVAYWAMARYLSGPGWGSPLDVGDLALSDLWIKVRSFIPERLRRVAGVEPYANSIEAGGLTIIAGRSRSSTEAAMNHQRVWLVRSLQHVSKMPNMEGFPTPSYCLVTTARPKGVIIELYEKRPSCP